MHREISRRNFLLATTAVAAVAAASGFPTPSEAAPRIRPLGRRPRNPLNPQNIRKFAVNLPNPLDPAFPGLRKPAAGTQTTLTIKETSLQLGLNLRQGTRMWAYQMGTAPAVVPGPTIEVDQGRPLTVTFVNGLGGLANTTPVDTTLDWANPGSLGGLAPVPLVTHLHGAASESRSDGLPDAWSTPADTYTGRLFAKPYVYENSQEAAHLWYHDHVLGVTRLNVNMGLAGFYFIRDQNESTLQTTNVLPSFPYEVPLMFMDRMFDRAGQLFYPFSDPAIAQTPTHLPEFFGDVMLVNGAVWPRLTVEKRKYRFRMLNASDSRFLALKVMAQNAPTATSRPKGTALPLMVIGNELGLLDAPANADWTTPGGITQPDTLLIGPGERYDVVIDFSNVPIGTRLLMWNDAATPYTGAPPDGVAYTAPVRGLTDRVMAFDVVALNPNVPNATVSLGTNLRPVLGPLPAASAANAQTTRKILLVEGTDQLGRLQTMLGTIADGTLNFRDPISETPKVNTTEIWEFYNTTADAHPIHMHLVDFRILDRQNCNVALVSKVNTDGSTGAAVDIANGGVTPIGAAVPPAAHEAGRKDTVVAYPGQVTRVLVSFNRLGEYVYHCHILSHEDHEMMRRYEVVA